MNSGVGDNRESFSQNVPQSYAPVYDQIILAQNSFLVPGPRPYRNEAKHEDVGGGRDGGVEKEDSVVADQVAEGHEKL